MHVGKWITEELTYKKHLGPSTPKMKKKNHLGLVFSCTRIQLNPSGLGWMSTSKQTLTERGTPKRQQVNHDNKCKEQKHSYGHCACPANMY
jgi:hypothetical protein